MRKSHVLGASTALVFILSIAWFAREPATAQKKPAKNLQKWEYKIKLRFTNALAEETFNKLGSEGWELCATPSFNIEGKPAIFVIFKRPKR